MLFQSEKGRDQISRITVQQHAYRSLFYVVKAISSLSNEDVYYHCRYPIKMNSSFIFKRKKIACCDSEMKNPLSSHKSGMKPSPQLEKNTFFSGICKNIEVIAWLLRGVVKWSCNFGFILYLPINCVQYMP